MRGDLLAKRILVVEDDLAALELIEYALQIEGYETLSAINGEEGISQAREHTPDLIVLDVMLPGLDGFEVCRRLKAWRETTHLPILMLSAKAQGTDVEVGRQAGAEAYLTKPIEPSVLVEKIRSLMDERPQNV